VQQVFDAVPVVRTVELAGLTFIKEFTVLLTHILLVLSTMSDLHRPLPINRSPSNRPLQEHLPKVWPREYIKKVWYLQNILVNYLVFGKQ
jgi:hypothetical protein